MSDVSSISTTLPQQPLAVYILWHPDSIEGAQIAEELFNCWQGESASTRFPSSGIPVFFVSKPPAGQTLPEAVDPGTAGRVALVLLVDDTLVDAAAWHDFLGQQVHLRKLHPHLRVFPIQLCDRAVTLHPLKLINFLNPPGSNRVARMQWIVNRLNHALCRMLPSTVRSSQLTGAQVRVFISHAKVDGLLLAKRIRNYINDKAQLDTFFDAHDIPYGDEFAETLEQSLGTAEMALLAIQTDQYASRAFCRREVLWAKKNEVPIVVLHAVESSEVRSFPYLGNSPTLRWRQSKYEDVLGVLLNEVLRARYFPLRLQYLSKIAGRQHLDYLVYHPELLTLAYLERRPGTPVPRKIVHPDPPLGTEETDLLYLVREDIEFTTLSTL